MAKKYKVRVEYSDGKREDLELVYDERRGAWKLQKPGLLGASFITYVSSENPAEVHGAIEASTGRPVKRVRLM